MSTMKMCAGCGHALSVYQTKMFNTPEKCLLCQTKDRIVMLLRSLPDSDEPEWARLSEFEQMFLPSVREQFVRKDSLTEKQYQILERIWEKINR